MGLDAWDGTIKGRSFRGGLGQGKGAGCRRGPRPMVCETSVWHTAEAAVGGPIKVGARVQCGCGNTGRRHGDGGQCAAGCEQQRQRLWVRDTRCVCVTCAMLGVVWAAAAAIVSVEAALRLWGLHQAWRGVWAAAAAIVSVEAALMLWGPPSAPARFASDCYWPGTRRREQGGPPAPAAQAAGRLAAVCEYPFEGQDNGP